MSDANDKALVPIEEKQVDFYGDQVPALLVETGEIYVPIKPISDYLGLSWSGQSERIRRDPVLSEDMQLIRVTRIKPGRGNQELLCLPLKYLNGWLFGVNAARVKPEVRDRLIRYQRECYDILYRAFQPAPVANPTLEQIRQMGLAIAQLAEEQMAMEQRLTARLDKAAIVFKGLDNRLTVVEKKLSPATLITEEQAEEVSGAVKALAEYLTGKDKSKNWYQGIFAELYRRFQVSTYKNIPLDQYPKVLEFLADWRKSADSGEAKDEG